MSHGPTTGAAPPPPTRTAQPSKLSNIKSLIPWILVVVLALGMIIVPMQSYKTAKEEGRAEALPGLIEELRAQGIFPELGGPGMWKLEDGGLRLTFELGQAPKKDGEFTVVKARESYGSFPGLKFRDPQGVLKGAWDRDETAWITCVVTLEGLTGSEPVEPNSWRLCLQEDIARFITPQVR